MSLNGGYTYQERIGAPGAGCTTADYLAARYTHTSAALWRERIAAGRVTVDGAVAAADTLLRRGDILAWARPPWEEPEAPLGFAVLHEDEAVVAVAKPSGLPTLPGANFLEHTLLHLVRRRYPGATPVHRLGRGTSGLVLFGRQQNVVATLSQAWKDGLVTKLYRAWVQGQPNQDRFDVRAPIGPMAYGAQGTLNAFSKAGKTSLSHVRVLERRESTALVEVRIATGRPHQIRIHMAYAGHPLVGDPLYASGGGFRFEGQALPGDLGYALHAESLELPHPSGGQLRLYCAPPPLLRTGGRP